MSYRDGSPNPGNQLYIRGLNFRTTELELRDIFHPFGDIEEVHIVKDPHLNECRGFAFVKFVNNEMAQRALKKVDGMDFHGHRLIVELSKRSKPRQKTPGEYLGSSIFFPFFFFFFFFFFLSLSLYRFFSAFNIAYLKKKKIK
ncbi:hypothetical protein HMI56_004272 [Coelomomyces lativittatus]|nr:hypothetical protein HMI56_004272 [Coelomomyces lativittatus]